MPIVPWRIACQSLTILDPRNQEPAVTLTFALDPSRSDVSLLRVTPLDSDAPAYEIEFNAGGMATGPGLYQERWLRPFERVDPNFHLDDDKAAKEHSEGLDGSNGERARYLQQRGFLLDRRDSFARRGEDPVQEDKAGEMPAEDQPHPVAPPAQQPAQFAGRPKR